MGGYGYSIALSPIPGAKASGAKKFSKAFWKHFDLWAVGSRRHAAAWKEIFWFVQNERADHATSFDVSDEPDGGLRLQVLFGIFPVLTSAGFHFVQHYLALEVTRDLLEDHGYAPVEPAPSGAALAARPVATETRADSLWGEARFLVQKGLRTYEIERDVDSPGTYRASDIKGGAAPLEKLPEALAMIQSGELRCLCTYCREARGQVDNHVVMFGLEIPREQQEKLPVAAPGFRVGNLGPLPNRARTLEVAATRTHLFAVSYTREGFCPTGTWPSACSRHRLLSSADDGASWIKRLDDERAARWEISSIASPPGQTSTLYALAWLGPRREHLALLRSADGGETFDPVDAPLGGADAAAMAFDPAGTLNVFAQSPDGACVLLRRSASQAAFERIDGGLHVDGPRKGISLHAHPTRSDVLWVALEGEYPLEVRVLRTVDGGRHWRASGAGLPGPCTSSLAVLPDRVLIIALATKKSLERLYVSRDDGEKFTEVRAQRPLLEVKHGNPRLFADARGDGSVYLHRSWSLFLSRDGEAFRAAAEQLTADGLVADPRDPRSVLLVAHDGVVRLTEDSATD
jgi:hypothetical protein